MPLPITAGLQCLFLLVTACSQTSQDSNFNPFIQYVIDSALGEESFQSEMQRQKRNMIIFDLPRVEYTIDVEVSVMDSSFLMPIKDYIKNLSLPILTNISNAEMRISNISVTTVCLPSGENNSCCSCEKGYAWPSVVCNDLIICPSASLKLHQSCSYTMKMPFYRPYCKPETEVDFIVDNSTTEVWNTLNKKEGLGSSSLLQSVEIFSLNLQPVNNTIPPVSTKTLQLKGIVVTGSNTSYDADFHSTENLTANVLIGEKEIQNLTQNSTIVSVMYSKLGNLLPENKTKSVNSLLITTTLSSNRSQNFNINMTFAKKNSSLEKPQCVFWNFKLNECRGGWDDQGCDTTDAEDNVICSCNHLTSFSILMSPGTSPQVIIEDYITYIGLAISILSLVICIIIESLVWKYVTNNTTSYMRHVCILNIATSLLIADIWFIVTASIADQNRQISKNICYVATFFIHLFYLCSFFWMLSLGLILFYRLVFILHDTSKTTQKAVAFCLGYGCPFVIAAITIGVTLPRNNYTRDGVCWLKWEDSKTLLAFVIPALMIVTMNLFITAVVIIKILRPTIGDRSNRQEKNALFQIGKSVAILTPLLGLTWGFGMATIIENSHRALHILFALLNALQGLFILVFGTLWDKKILEALLKRNSMSKWSSQQTKSSSLILVTPMLAMSYPFSRTFNNLCGKTGKYRVSSSEPCTSSSENTSKSYSLLN